MPREIRIFGPPGTGKTSYASRQVRNAAEKFGSDSVLVASFTKTAAAAIAGRDLAGVKAATLHAHCWRGLDRPKIAELYISKAKDGITPFNEAYPHLWLSDSGKADIDGDVPEFGENENDVLLADAMRYRAMLLPVDYWPSIEAQNFNVAWNDWKEQQGLLDFTDLISVSMREMRTAPGAPKVGVFDEVQDFTPLQLALIREWSHHMDYVMLCGDDDQTLYQWTGCSPRAFLEPDVPDDQKRILAQSYRVPRKVFVGANKWISRVTFREPKPYQPRDYDGAVRHFSASFRDVQPLLNDMQQYLDQGKTVMFLTSCGYMLGPLLKVMRDEGIPFHNPYRAKAGHWNPLRTGNGTSAGDRIAMFLRPQTEVWGEDARMWTYREVGQWASTLRAKGVFRHGQKQHVEALKERKDRDLIGWEELGQWFEESALGPIYDGDLDWYYRNTADDRQKPMTFPMNVINKHGPQALMEPPKVMVGTIHSVKGGEADVVYLFPDLSARGWVDAWAKGGEARDSIYRLFYVGMTRPRDTLVIGAPATQMAVNL